jgi:hypothetical protein
MTKVYVLMQSYDYDTDGYHIIGAFSTLQLVRHYIASKYPDFTKKDDWHYKCKNKEDNDFTPYSYLVIHELEVNDAE